MSYGMTDDFIDMRDERDAAHRELATLKAALAESDIRIAGVEAERDHYRAGLAESERCVSCVEAERDAYRAALAELLPKCACGCFASVRTRSGKLWCTRCAVSVTGTGWGFHGAATRAALALLAGYETKTGGK